VTEGESTRLKYVNKKKSIVFSSVSIIGATLLIAAFASPTAFPFRDVIIAIGGTFVGSVLVVLEEVFERAPDRREEERRRKKLEEDVLMPRWQSENSACMLGTCLLLMILPSLRWQSVVPSDRSGIEAEFTIHDFANLSQSLHTSLSDVEMVALEQLSSRDTEAATKYRIIDEFDRKYSLALDSNEYAAFELGRTLVELIMTMADEGSIQKEMEGLLLRLDRLTTRITEGGKLCKDLSEILQVLEPYRNQEVSIGKRKEDLARIGKISGLNLEFEE
jgi:hypothetical protein